MLWHKAWLDARWRILIGLAVLLVMACGVVVEYPTVVRLRPVAMTINPGDGAVGRAIRDAIETQRDYRGYVWYAWYRQNLCQALVLLAAVLGSGRLLDGGAARFTLTLPVSRRQVYTVRAASGLAALLLLALVPSLVIPLLSPGVGERYALDDVLVHGVCLFVGGAVIYSAALALSAVFTDFWRPLLLAVALAVALTAVEMVAIPSPSVGVIHAMTGESYFRSGALPWVGLGLSAGLSALLLAAGASAFERHDF